MFIPSTCFQLQDGCINSWRYCHWNSWHSVGWASYSTHARTNDWCFQNNSYRLLQDLELPALRGRAWWQARQSEVPSKLRLHVFNYKNFFSVVLQAAVDARYKFIAIDVGGYGKQSDGGTFQASGLYQSVMDKTIILPDPAPLPQSDVVAPYVFVADEAYPLLTFLMKPYSGGDLPLSQECFNKRLSRTRKVVECAFGILNSKWCILSKCIDTRVDLADSIIKCVCILHNTIIDREGMDQNLTEVVSPRSGVAWELAGRPTNNAKGVRDIFTSFFDQNPIVYS